MKIKIFALILSLVIVSLSIIACVEIPLGPSESMGENSGSQVVSGSAGVSEPEESSKDDPLDEYFRDSVFIGNSIMVHFYNYVSAKRATYSDFLGKCKFLAASAYSPKLEFDSNPQTQYMIKYQGEYMHVWDAVQKMGAKTAYVSLMALNELGLHPNATCAEDTFDNMVRMLDKIKEVNPGINIVVLSNTYMVNTFNYKNLNNKNIYKLNSLMLDYCNANNIAFLDVTTPLTVDGYLKTSYCIDPDPNSGNGCHLQQKCYNSWVAVLRNYAYAMQNGGYKNIEVMPEP